MMVGTSEEKLFPKNEGQDVELIDSESPEGILRLKHSRHQTGLKNLSAAFETQKPHMCGAVSLAIVLNALRVRPGGARAYSQDTVFLPGEKPQKMVLGPVMVDGKLVRDPGFQLRQLHSLARAHGLDSKIRVLPDGFQTRMVRNELISALLEKDTYVIVDFYRPVLGQSGGGHYSPLGAYDEASDSCLLLDVNAKRPWVWVGTDDLVAAMRTFDTAENRGYLILH